MWLPRSSRIAFAVIWATTFSRTDEARARRGHRFDLRVVDLFDCFVENLGAKTGGAEQTVSMMRASVSNLPEEAYARLHKELSSAVRRATADLLKSNVHLYLEHFSPEEVNDLNAFYSTPSGKKMLQVIPALMQQSLYLRQEWTQRLDRDVHQTCTERLKQEGYLNK